MENFMGKLFKHFSLKIKLLFLCCLSLTMSIRAENLNQTANK